MGYDGYPANPGSFKPGQSGNPGGKMVSREVAELARRYTPDAIRALVEVTRTAIDSPSARVSAATVLLDRGWGKPRQDIDLHGDMGQALHLHLYAVQRLEQVRQVAAELEAPPIEGEAIEFRDELLPRPDDSLPHEALPLWDAARTAPAAPSPPPDAPPVAEPPPSETALEGSPAASGSPPSPDSGEPPC